MKNRVVIALMSLQLAAVLVWSSCRNAAADDQGGLPPSVLAIIENGERLRSGEYRARGRIATQDFAKATETGLDKTPAAEFDEQIDAAFDFDAGCNLFRRRRVHLGGPIPKFNYAERYRWYLQIPGQTVSIRGTELHRTAVIRLSTPWTDLWPDELSTPLPQPVSDPRLLGWAGWGSLCVSFEAMTEQWFRKAELRAADEGNGIHRIEAWQKVEEGLSMMLTWWCDEQQGWQPIRWSARWHYTSPMARAEERNSKSKPHEESEHTWEKHGDVWVVKSLAAHVRGPRGCDLEMSFDWKNVNEPVPVERFEWKHWNYPRDYQEIEDRRLGDQNSINITDHRGAPYEQSLSSPLRPATKNPGQRWLLFVNIAVFSVVAGWLGRRLLVRQ